MRTANEENIEPPYFVEVDKYGCNECGHDTYWTVVGFDCGLGRSWSDEEEAQYVADVMNMAYMAGREQAER